MYPKGPAEPRSATWALAVTAGFKGATHGPETLQPPQRLNSYIMVCRSRKSRPRALRYTEPSLYSTLPLRKYLPGVGGTQSASTAHASSPPLLLVSGACGRRWGDESAATGSVAGDAGVEGSTLSAWPSRWRLTKKSAGGGRGRLPLARTHPVCRLLPALP